MIYMISGVYIISVLLTVIGQNKSGYVQYVGRSLYPFQMLLLTPSSKLAIIYTIVFLIGRLLTLLTVTMDDKQFKRDFVLKSIVFCLVLPLLWYIFQKRELKRFF